jgi:cytochrome c553
MYIGWQRLILILAGLAAGSFLFAWSGLFNVAASSGHWAFTEWFLHWTMRNSVRTHALGIDPPPLDDPALVHRGAGHYASGCAPCHAAPGHAHSPVAREMTPMPPILVKQIPKWNRAQLFWIVKHGVKYTGMPAWVAQQREDEVWAMVAFLERLPELTPAAYRRLSLGPEADHPEADHAEQLADLSEPLREVLPECARCHGRDGAGRGVGAFPILTGQTEAYLYRTLKAYMQGHRHSGIMQPAAAGLDEDIARALARHYAAADAAVTGSGPSDLKLIRRGKIIASRGVPADLVPACAACHGPKSSPRRPVYPELAGQHAGYLAQQLSLFQQDARGGTSFAPIMHMIAKQLSEAQIRAVAAYYAALDPP